MSVNVRTLAEVLAWKYPANTNITLDLGPDTPWVERFRVWEVGGDPIPTEAQAEAWEAEFHASAVQVRKRRRDRYNATMSPEQTFETGIGDTLDDILTVLSAELGSQISARHPKLQARLEQIARVKAEEPKP